MLHYAAGFLLSALIAAVLGFGEGIAVAPGMAKTLFVVFVLGAVATLALHRPRA